MSISLAEHLIPLAEAARTLPGGCVHVSTVHRWWLKGCRGVKLETILRGGVRYTSTEAIERFVAATTAAADCTTPVVPTGKKLLRRISPRRELSWRRPESNSLRLPPVRCRGFKRPRPGCTPTGAAQRNLEMDSSTILPLAYTARRESRRAIPVVTRVGRRLIVRGSEARLLVGHAPGEPALETEAATT